MRNCNCSNTIRQNKDEIRKKAIKYAEVEKVDVQVHTWTQRGFGRLYDFEEAGSVDRGKGIIEIIRFRDLASENVLQDTEGNKRNKKKPREISNTKTGRSRRKSSNFDPEVAESDEPIGESKSGSPTTEVEGDNRAVL